jgi:hypothetical protein
MHLKISTGKSKRVALLRPPITHRSSATPFFIGKVTL